MKKVILLFCFIGGIFAKSITLDFLQKQPRGVVRDFYIWYFIDQDKTSINEAKQAYELVFRKTPRIEKAMEKKGIIHEMPRDIYCKKLDFELLKQEDPQCIAYGLKLSMIATLSGNDATQLLVTLKDAQPKLYEQIKILRDKNVLHALLNTTPENFANIFNGLSYVQKIALLDSKKIDPDALLKLLDENFAAFNRVITTIILDSRFYFVKEALGKIEVKSSDTNTFFLLGINELMLKTPNIPKALRYFEKSQKAAIDPFMQDRALFWQYLISEDKKFLEQLTKSSFVDIFSIYANQKLGTTPQYEVVTSLDNISTKKSDMDITNPFVWQNYRSKITELNGEDYIKSLEVFYHQDTIPHLIYFLNRQYRYSRNYFLFAYDNPRMWKNDEEKAMTYAVARQESQLLPALVSSSYALGIMQIMPFNVKPFAEALKMKNITLFDMFDPKIALKFGTFYLEELREEFKHPLFVAYAYNGGPGFLRRTLAKKQLFLKNRKYEPWISLELLPYEESRFYGMKVLANYIIYAEILNKKINIKELLDQTLQF
ncbi:lytic transglycosylase domain-containing protein [Helicobacter anatolicus]|uniref:lytic transglycosylase domain-containing protein n=1 Tax=Helicobacter anatolicus TaxID=2905874 RepID=UPI001E508501|nr:lytic transglycosylase domain-containing protein [Helicobacter anatolicus]MCE3039280.1 lytic transglycosylase domain-containing protein [Helicobacter anatolicus]